MPRHKSSGRKKNGTPKKPPLTHFLCIPLVTPASRPQLETSIERFRADVRAALSTGAVTEDLNPSDTAGAEDKATVEAPTHGEPKTENRRPTPSSLASLVSEKAVRPVDTLHLTLGVMSLDDDDTLARATELLGTLDVAALLRNPTAAPSTPPSEPSRPRPGSPGPGDTGTDSGTPAPLTLTLKGLTSMHAPSSTSILYVSPQDPTGRLHPLCTALRAAFEEADLLVPDPRSLKLHATVLNTIYAKGAAPSAAADAGHGPKAKAPLRLDARDILGGYRDAVWAEGLRVDRVAVCEMGAKKVLDTSGNVVGSAYGEVAVRTL